MSKDQQFHSCFEMPMPALLAFIKSFSSNSGINVEHSQVATAAGHTSTLMCCASGTLNRHTLHYITLHYIHTPLLQMGRPAAIALQCKAAA
jgi:hypothetical protein